METSNLIFIDTWAWLALANRKDTYHERANKYYFKTKKEKYLLITSDYVLDEVITALFINVAFDSAVKFVESLFTMIKDGQLGLEKITDKGFKEAWALRKKYADKPDVSFTDLTTFVVMQKRRIRRVFTGDSHFEKVNLGFEITPYLK